MHVHIIVVFLDKAGKRVWQTEDEPGMDQQPVPDFLRETYLEPNGIYASDILLDSVDDCAWVRVDAKKTSFRDFYSWEEALQRPDKPECWRTFYFFSSESGEEFWSPVYVQHPGAEIQGLGNVYCLFEKVKQMRV